MSTNPARVGGQGNIAKDVASVPYATPPPMTVLGYETLTVSNAAVGLAAVQTKADSVILRVDTNPIRWRADGANPTASQGMPMLVADQPLFLVNLGLDQLYNLKFIRSGGADGILYVTYVRVRG